ncbi:MAG: hypothetical protein MJ074_08455 [Oscillospiraceae bacterium]|nr:hypothetical protein [Oscillospiraceae bacterium]
MIRLTLDNWVLQSCEITEPAFQMDNNTVDILVLGDIPSGFAWELLTQHEEYMDVTHLDVTPAGLSATLTAEQLAFDGYYDMQLRASREGSVKHSSTIKVRIGRTISGDEQWPEVPTVFTQALDRAEDALAAASEMRGAGYATFDVDVDTGSLIMTYPDDYYGPVFRLTENGELEVVPNGNN